METMNRILALLRNEEGIETLEWIAMAFLIIVLIAVAVYPGNLLTAVNSVITNITSHL